MPLRGGAIQTKSMMNASSNLDQVLRKFIERKVKDMNIVNAGSRYLVYGEDVKTYHELPVGTYEVNFNQMQGYSLAIRPNLLVKEDKVYGASIRKVEKVLDAFERTNRNLGVILSGKKGIGKSLFARILASEANKAGLPLINVSTYTPGIANFLGSIDQKVVVLFDEFEKTFSNDREDCNPQEEMLPLFDGIDSGKKLFVVTCNDVYRLNDFLVNRPGRFHYHFALRAPSADEIIEYLEDKLLPQYKNVIKDVVSVSIYTEITYDSLRAIVFELNNGYSLKETLEDLNIAKSNDSKFDIFITFNDGTIAQASSHEVNFAYDETDAASFSYNGKRNVGRLYFNPNDIIFDLTQSIIYLPAADASISFSNEFESEKGKKPEVEKVLFVRSMPVNDRILV